MKQAIAELMAKTANAFKSKPELLMFLIHGLNERLYRVIKTCVMFTLVFRLRVYHSTLS
jgi:hypothetical protein